jgi:hypothetical protein
MRAASRSTTNRRRAVRVVLAALGIAAATALAIALLTSPAHPKRPAPRAIQTGQPGNTDRRD